MNRKIVLLVLCILFCVSFTVSVAAQDGMLVSDHAELFTDEERSALETTAQTLADTYNMDFAILIVRTLDGNTARDYADDYYDQNGFRQDGLVFLLAMEEREWYISTCGNAIDAFTDYGLMRLEDAIVPRLSEEKYYEAFCLFYDCVPDYLEAYLAGSPIDRYSGSEGAYYQPQKSVSDILLISVIVGLAAAVVSILLMRYSMNTKRRQHSAGEYLSQGSFQPYMHRDIYLYSNISKVRRQQNTGSSGGSSVHRSSGGRSHGGRGGRF